MGKGNYDIVNKIILEMEAEASSMEITASRLRKNATKLRAQLQGGVSVAAPKRGPLSEKEIATLRDRVTKNATKNKPAVGQRA